MTYFLSLTAATASEPALLVNVDAIEAVLPHTWPISNGPRRQLGAKVGFRSGERLTVVETVDEIRQLLIAAAVWAGDPT